MEYKLLPRLMLITDRTVCDEPLSVRVEKACQAGTKLIQLREKNLPVQALLDEATRLREITQKYGAYLLINDRVDIAMLTKADGVHLPESGFAVHSARQMLPGKWIGKSVHSLESAVAACQNSADYVVFGPIFDTPSKRAFGAPQGVDKLLELCSHISCPVFAVGGITPERISDCLNAGAYGVAAIGAFMKSKDPQPIIQKFQKELNIHD